MAIVHGEEIDASRSLLKRVRMMAQFIKDWTEQSPMDSTQ